MSTHQYSRTIGTFSNSGTAFEDGYELVVGYSSDKKGLSPVLGLVLGSTTVQAWDEIGSVQSKLAYDEINQSYNVLTLGMAYNTDKIGVAASYNTTSEVDLALKVKNLEVSMARDIDSSENSFGLGYNIKF